jgi:hypothetical protein
VLDFVSTLAYKASMKIYVRFNKGDFMNKSFPILMIMMLTMMLIFSGCGGSDNSGNPIIPTRPDEVTPAMADWLLVISPVLNSKIDDPAVVMLYCLDVLNYPTAEDAIIVTINGTDIGVTSFFMMPGIYIGSALLDQGQTYDVEFLLNGTSKVNSSIKIAYLPNAVFPQNYDYTEPATISWTVVGNSQYQFAGASSKKEDTEEASDHVRQLEPGIRTYTVPANSVDDFGPGTEYTLGVDQINYKVVNRIAMMSIGSDVQTYYSKRQLTLSAQVERSLMLYGQASSE